MPISADQFEQRIARLKADLVEQGHRVQRMVDSAVKAVFERNAEDAQWVIENDEVIDRVDIEIERAAVALLAEIAACETNLPTDQIRWILTIVKLNNELERIADEAVSMAEVAPSFIGMPSAPPVRFRMMANSVIGILQQTNRSIEQVDVALAQSVLTSDDLVDEFESQILRDMQQQLSDGEVVVDFAFGVNKVTAALERIDDHCTNIAEQVIYIGTGKIVRHTSGHWSEPQQPY